MVAVEQSRQSQSETKTGKPRWMQVIWPTFVVGTGILLTVTWMGGLAWLFLEVAQVLWLHMMT
jgi:hypothetical protein